VAKVAGHLTRGAPRVAVSHGSILDRGLDDRIVLRSDHACLRWGRFTVFSFEERNIASGTGESCPWFVRLAVVWLKQGAEGLWTNRSLGSRFMFFMQDQHHHPWA
jgi:hypothetical protein